MIGQDLKIIGSECQRLRRILNKKQKDIGNELGYATVTISQFERGNNNNLYIFSWYLRHGLDTHRLNCKLRGYLYGEKAE